MGRLIEIIKENEESPSVTNRNYHMFSGIGNLFNLMMIISPENPYPFPVDANVSIISKMLSDFEDAKTVKALQTQFNKIKGFIKNNKIPKADVKKKYFLLLFNLLKSETDLKLNPTTLSNKFAAGGSSGAAKQRPEVIKIGKALLTSGKVELNQKDVKIIKTFMSHLGAGEEDTPIEQPVEDIENITKNTEEPVTPEGVDVVAKEMSEKTDDQLREIADKSDMIVKGVKDRHIDETAELEEVFNTNEDSNIFKVQFTDLDVEVGEIINKKIADNHAKIKAEYDLKTANFISKLTYDMFEQLDKNVNGYLNHFEDYIQIDVKKTNWLKLLRV